MFTGDGLVQLMSEVCGRVDRSVVDLGGAVPGGWQDDAAEYYEARRQEAVVIGKAVAGTAEVAHALVVAFVAEARRAVALAQVM